MVTNPTVRTRTSLPGIGVGNVYFTGGVVEAKETSWNDGNRVLLVVNAIELRDMCVNVVGERLVADLEPINVIVCTKNTETYPRQTV
jgi:hypothetical protein